MEQRTTKQKLENLRAELGQMQSLMVAFSGGVDSAFLLKTAQDVLGDRVRAVTAVSASFPEREYRETVRFCEENGIRHEVVETDEMEIEGFCENPENRCYLCKKEIFGTFRRLAEKEGIAHIAEGSNLDDCGDYRPGMLAVRELGILSPLKAAGLGKTEIRELARQMGLAVWNKPSFACLASRFPYGERITREGLRKVEAGEQFLLEQGFTQFRVRVHGGNLARIEVRPEQIGELSDTRMRQRITEKFKAIGFTYVAMDLQGYRTGSMNEVLAKSEAEHGTEGRDGNERNS